MKCNKIKNYKDEEFRRLSGFKRSTFKKMIEILEEGGKKKKAGGGKPKTRPMEERLLMALKYLREYFHVASSYEISESICYINIKWIEDTRIQHPDFALSGRKA